MPGTPDTPPRCVSGPSGWSSSTARVPPRVGRHHLGRRQARHDAPRRCGLGAPGPDRRRAPPGTHHRRAPAAQGAREGGPRAPARQRDIEGRVDFLRDRARRSNEEVVRYIDSRKDRWGVEPICKALQFAPATYYAARSRPPCARRVRDEALKPEIHRVYDENRRRLRRRQGLDPAEPGGYPVARCTVERLMRDLGSAARDGPALQATTVADESSSPGRPGRAPVRR